MLTIFKKELKIFHAIRWNPISDTAEDRIFRLIERIFAFKTTSWICNSYSAKKTLVKLRMR